MNNPGSPSASQLAATRAAHWHHDASPILTTNMLRDWLNTSGLVLYTPRPQQLATPAPSFAEVILGQANATPTLAELAEPRTMLARLIADGGAIPLNLFSSPSGAGTETPDFIVSPLAFSYIFTLRGDKTWKQPPVTSGPTKVSPLALATYNLISAKGQMSASELATELSNEVTEAAALRALTELWQHLRVLPILQADGSATLWELATTRYTKQIKAGANAGQPTALSALISLYLGQAILPTEEEIEIFLSPLAARSRIRDVVHALTSARQLENVVIDGKARLYVSGEFPTLVEPAVDATEAAPDASVVPAEAAPAEALSTETKPERISRFKSSSSGEFRERKPFAARRTEGRDSASRPARGRDDGFKPRGEGRSDRERRPFRRDERPSFTKPWDEERRERTPFRKPENADAPKRPYRSNDSAEAGERPRRPFRDRESSGPRRPSGGFKDSSSRRPFGDSSERKPFTRKPFAKPFARKDDDGRDDKPRFKDRPSYRGSERSSGDDSQRPARRTSGKPFGERKSFAPKFDRPRSDRPRFDKPKFDRSESDRPKFDGPRSDRPRFDKPKFDRPKSDRPRFDKPRFDGPRSERSASDKPKFDRPKKSFSGKPERSGGAGPRRERGDKPFAKGGKPFAKFAGKVKPFAKRGAPSGKPRREKPE
ncbi:MAG TPA: hypothetical protein VIM60_00440 [Edaphobacter sp.]